MLPLSCSYLICDEFCALVLDPKNLFKQEGKKGDNTIVSLLSLKADLKKPTITHCELNKKSPIGTLAAAIFCRSPRSNKKVAAPRLALD